MATNTFVEIQLPQATDLADLTGIEHDLLTARQFAIKLQEIMEGPRVGFDLIEPLTTAILVRYSRPFSGGVRKQLGTDALARLSEAQREKHRRLRAYRNKHIAHSENEFELNQPIARFWAERVHAEGISSIECNHTRVAGLSSGEIDSVIELTSALLSYVQERLRMEKAAVLDIVRAMPIETVLAMGRKTFPQIDSGAVYRRRGK